MDGQPGWSPATQTLPELSKAEDEIARYQREVTGEQRDDDEKKAATSAPAAWEAALVEAWELPLAGVT